MYGNLELQKKNFISEFQLQFKFELDHKVNIQYVVASLYLVVKYFSYTFSIHLA
jgi:hypothetical protein